MIKKTEDDDLELGDFSNDEEDSDEEEDMINHVDDYLRERTANAGDTWVSIRNHSETPTRGR